MQVFFLVLVLTFLQVKERSIHRNSQTSEDVDCNVGTVVLCLRCDVSGRALQKVSPLGETSKYYDDQQHTQQLQSDDWVPTETIVCQKPGYLWCSCALTVLCIQRAAIAETNTYMACMYLLPVAKNAKWGLLLRPGDESLLGFILFSLLKISCLN